MNRLSFAAILVIGCTPAEAPPANVPPTAPSVVIFPAEPLATDWLDAVILGEAVDPEGGTVTYRYEWRVDGVVADFAQDLGSVWPDETRSGQVWQVSVFGVDEQGEQGLPGTVGVTVRGSVPSIDGALLGPAGATPLDALQVEALGWEDADGDEPRYQYTWFSGGRELDLEGPMQSPGRFAAGDSVFVVVTPVDQETEGAGLDSNTVVIRPPDACGAVVLDGVDDHVTVEGGALPSTPDFAVEAWLVPMGAGVVASTRTGIAGWELSLTAAGVPVLWVGGAELLGAGALTFDGVPHHLAATRNDMSGLAVLYVDGDEVASASMAPPTGEGPLVFGRSSDSASRFLSGILDDVRISSIPRYRDAFEPANYWPQEPTAVGIWSWSEGVGVLSEDAAGARAATLVGASWSASPLCDSR